MYMAEVSGLIVLREAKKNIKRNIKNIKKIGQRWRQGGWHSKFSSFRDPRYRQKEDEWLNSLLESIARRLSLATLIGYYK